jgi:glycosyltransferase involved in cell wall biosynthesis
MVKKVKNNKKKSKQQKAQEKQQREKKRIANLPFVSVCTPTFNRRPFFEYAIKNFTEQDYPAERMEWIIIDDGTDPIEDLVKDVPGVKYFYVEEKMKLGRKRNMMHDKSSGDIIVYMDDDDYYPRDRVSHAVAMLQKNPNALCAGSSAIYIWFKHIEKMFKFGPYGPNHSTAGTFAFRKELLLQTRYDDDAALAEEKHFLKNYTIPFVQLDPLKTILVFSHIQNTFDKRELLVNWEKNKTISETNVTVDDFIVNKDVKEFYTERLNDLLAKYEPGDMKHKPDVIKQTKEIKEKRAQMSQDMVDKQKSAIVITQNGVQTALTNGQVKQVMQQQQTANIELKKQVEKLTIENKKLLLLVKRLNDKIEGKYPTDTVDITDISQNMSISINDL